RSRSVLGWSNEAKIAALENQARSLQAQISKLGGSIALLQKEQAALKQQLGTLGKLDEYRDFRELDWQPFALDITRLPTETRELAAASDVLAILSGRLTELLAVLADTDLQLDKRKDAQSRAQQKHSDALALLNQVRAVCETADFSVQASHFERIEPMLAEAA